MKWGRAQLAVGLALALAAPLGALAQDAPKPVPQVPPHPIILPPQAKSPVELFRELLAMPREERSRFLSNRSPEARKMIIAKLREYETLRPELRELRLKSTELRWYLLPLMRAPATNRNDQLQFVPAEDRELVAARLKEWDTLKPDVQQELLQNEATLQYFTEINSDSPPPVSAARREKLEAAAAQWRSLPEEKRREIVFRFNRFFELKPEEKARALENLSPAERRQIDRTLKSFERLPENKRQQCISSFEKLAGMSQAERQDFFKNAERWKIMSPEERQSWRELVSHLSHQPPPVPPPPLPGTPLRRSTQAQHVPGPAVPPPPVMPQPKTNS